LSNVSETLLVQSDVDCYEAVVIVFLRVLVQCDITHLCKQNLLRIKDLPNIISQLSVLMLDEYISFLIHVTFKLID